MPERVHLAIGEVLGLLQEEFPDITISKIRFLESQGLLDPERTPSGYRKFYDADIDRLRWILRHQRDQFLPLRVIKARLEALGRRPDPVPGAEPYRVPADEVADGHAGRPTPAPIAEPSSPTLPPAPPAPPAPAAPPAPTAPSRLAVSTDATRVSPAPDDAPSAPAATGPPPVGSVAALAGALDAGRSEVTFTRAELAAAAGLGDRDLEQLVQYGLLHPRVVGRDEVFEGESLAVARLAAAFGRYGVEARHLRMYQTFADREVAVYEQLVTPLVRQRNPSSRAQAATRFGELAGLGGTLREALLRQALHDLLH